MYIFISCSVGNLSNISFCFLLIKLYDENPVLAANLTRKLFDSGYMT